MLALQDGILEHVLSTEPTDFKLTSFLSKIGRSPIGQLHLLVAPEAAVDSVYPLQAATFSGSLASWIGRYQKPQENVSFKVRGVRDGTSLEIASNVNFPRESFEHSNCRGFGRVPGSMLCSKKSNVMVRTRPPSTRLSVSHANISSSRPTRRSWPFRALCCVLVLFGPEIPCLRVKTDESIVSVVALFPFGLVQPLRYLSSEDIWQTRFLAPTDMQDGTYTVRLILRDRPGHTYRESKTFVIASKPPVVQVKLDRKRFQRGQVIHLKVSASQSTRTLVARLEGAAPVELRWDARAASNTGALVISGETIPGSYTLTVTAEDIAHNIGTQEVQIEVLP